jgi:crotonobetaine/carnitine-CoA ligase
VAVTDGPPPLAPAAHASLRDLLERQAAALGQQPFVRLPDAELSFAEADDLVNRVAEVLADLGYGAGDIVMVRAGNGWGTFAAWLACAKLGAVYLPLNALLSGDPLRQVMAHSRGRILLVAAALLPEVEAIREGLPSLRHVLVIGGEARANEGLPRLDDLVAEASGRAPAPLAHDPSAPAKPMYTSGTTGTPKGVLWSRTCEVVWAEAYGRECLPLDPGEAVYCCLPLFHVTCQGTVLAALGRGGRAVIDDRFDPLSFWTRVRRADAVMLTFVGTILSALVRRRPDPTDGENRVRRAVGAATPADRWREVEDRFELQIVETWGQTETASCWSWPARGLPQIPGTVGVPSDRWEARIVDPDGRSLDAGRAGELLVRPRVDHVMFEGYLGADGPHAPTRESWDADGWYRTGDILRWTDDGDLAFVGRHRDAIRRAGEMISPSFIEEAATTHPGILEAAAIGVQAGGDVDEEVLLCVVPVEGVELALEEVASFLAHLLPRYLVPRWLRIHAELPKTPTTRVRKFELRALGTAGAWDTRRRRFVEPDAGIRR